MVVVKEVILWTIPYPADIVSLLKCDQRPLPRLYLMCLGEYLYRREAVGTRADDAHAFGYPRGPKRFL